MKLKTKGYDWLKMSKVAMKQKKSKFNKWLKENGWAIFTVSQPYLFTKKTGTYTRYRTSGELYQLFLIQQTNI